MAYNKIFKNLDEQIEILEEKGLVVDDYNEAKDILLRENYFFLSGYRHLFTENKKGSHFIPGATFDELYSMFMFDRKIRIIFFQFILIVENNIKSIISYQLSKKYGFKEKEYLDPKNFTQDPIKVRQVHDILNKMKRQIRINGHEHSATMHYIDNYGYIPLWILVKVLSFGIISELYGILKYEDQQSIADLYGLDVETMSIYLSLLANYRNICAHEEVMYNHRSQRSIPNTKYHRFLEIPKDVDNEFIYGKNDLYAVIIIMKDMLTDSEFNDLINQIQYEVDIINGKINSIKIMKILNSCGFPDNWINILDIEK